MMGDVYQDQETLNQLSCLEIKTFEIPSEIKSTAPLRGIIDHTSFPHLIEKIVAYSCPRGLIALRASCRHYRAVSDLILKQHVVVTLRCPKPDDDVPEDLRKFPVASLTGPSGLRIPSLLPCSTPQPLPNINLYEQLAGVVVLDIDDPCNRHTMFMLLDYPGTTVRLVSPPGPRVEGRCCMTPGFLFNRQRAIQDVVVFADYVLDAPKPQDDSTEAPRPFRPTLHYSPITRQLEIQHLTIVFPVRPPPHFIFEDYNVAFDLSIPEFLANLKTLTLVFKPLELDIAHDSLRNFVWGRTSVIQFLSWILQSPLLPHIRITVIGLETVFPDMANKEADVESFRNDIVAGVYDERVSPPPSKPDCHLELITYQQYCERSHVVDAAVHTWKTIPTLGVEYVPGEQRNLIAQMMERFHKDLL